MWYSVCPSCFEGSSALLWIRGFMQSFQEPCDFQSSAVEVFYRPHHTSLIRQGERKRGSEAEQERKSASAAVSTHSSVERHQFTSLWTHAVSHSLRQTDKQAERKTRQKTDSEGGQRFHRDWSGMAQGSDNNDTSYTKSPSPGNKQVRET